MSGCIPLLANSHSPVFLVNSCLDRFSAPGSRQDPFSRSYGVNLPSSLTVNLSSALVYSTRPPVSVCGTGHAALDDSGFSREPDYHHYHSPRRARVLSRFGWSSVLSCRPITYAGSTGYSVSPRVCHFSVSVFSCDAGAGILTGCPSADSYLSRLRSRLTLIRLALIRNPWSYGGRVSRPPYRYLYLHLLFRWLHHGSHHGFCT